MNYGFRGWPGVNLPHKPDLMDYSSEVRIDQPSAYYRLDELTGTAAADSSGNNRTGTYSGDFLLGQPGALPDFPNTSVRFGGSSAIVACPALPRLLTFSVEAWFKLVGTQPGSAAIVSDIYPSNINFCMEIGGNGLWVGHYNGTWHQTPTYLCTAGVWYHALGTFDGTTLTLYVNGVQVGTTVDSSAPNTSSAGWRIARRWDNPDFVNGWIDEVAVYDHAVPAARVLRHYQAA
jgi:hypothetical protein